MLAIRLQRLGRSGYPTYRIAVQEAQRHPSSGRVVAYVGSYNPHTKETTLDAEKVTHYLGNGAQPTPRVVKILVEQKVKLPEWVIKHTGKKHVTTKNTEKLRKNQPKEEVAEEIVEEVVETPVADVVEDAPAETPAE
ncbi:MAG: 30S ribosomal protein S16 [Candidatus Saccharimonadales bacterium]|jgi:small subunit ribosomal protein S16